MYDPSYRFYWVWLSLITAFLLILFRSYIDITLHVLPVPSRHSTGTPLLSFWWDSASWTLSCFFIIFTLFNVCSIMNLFIYLLLYVTFNSQGYIVTGSLQVEETSAYCTVNHRASASNYQLSNMKRPARDSNRRPQRLEARTLTTTPPSPLCSIMNTELSESL